MNDKNIPQNSTDQDLLYAFFESNSLPIVLTTFELEVVDLNQKAADSLEYPKKELIGKQIMDFTVVDFTAENRPNIIELIDGKVDNFHVRRDYKTRTGKILSGYLIGSLFIHPKTNEKHIAAILYQQNENIPNQIDSILDSNNTLISKVLSLSPDINYIMDIENRVNIYQNFSLFEYLGYDNNDAKIEGEIDFLYTKIDHKSVKGLKKFKKDFWDSKNEGNFTQIEYKIQTKSGEWRWLHTRTSPIKSNDEGKPIYSFGTIQDITERVKTTEKIKRQQAFIEKVTNTLPDFIFVFNINNLNLLYSNFKNKPFLGLNEKEWNTKGFSGIDFEYRENAINLLTKIKRLKDNTILEDEQEYKIDGEIRYFESRNIVFRRDDDDNVEEVLSLVSDITDKKKAEKRLIEHQQFIKKIVYTVPSSLYVYNIDTLEIVYTNIEEKNFLGYTLEEWRTEGMNALHPSFYEEAEKNLKKFREFSDNEIAKNEMIYKNKSGEWVWVSFSSRVFMRNPDGSVAQMLTVGTNIDEQKKTIQELGETKEKQKKILEAIPDLILKIDREGNYLDIYPSKSENGYNPPASILGKNIKDVLPIVTSKIVLEKLDEAFESKKVVFFDIERKMSGIIYYLNAHISLIDDNEAILVVRNVSQQKEMEKSLDTKVNELSQKNDELEKYITKNSELERFAYIVSHDLKEPIRSVKAFAEILEKQYGETMDDTAKQYMNFITSGVDRMNSLIDGILDFSKIEETGTAFTNVSLDSTTTKVIQDLNHVIKEKEVKLEIHPLPNVKGDNTQLRQLIQNLINNAIKFCDKKPIIIINAKEEENQFVISVQDNGIGIRKENQEKIFSMFRRLHKKDQYSGQGIGLALCKRIVDRHNGNIWVESTVGEGTTFYFSIPKSV